ncbi:MAG: hydrocarbon binding protein (contains V4R domain) [Methanomicrobiales archaeon]|nr:hydrocarbon binding protein (contains V4R domain) [Methanomicrobiales archaeon]MDI6875268.1 hydrocarbon binding protein (contains V4R domain) [Methanomicrobiales archaeon]
MVGGHIEQMNETFHTDTVYRSEDVPLSCRPNAADVEDTLHGLMKLNGLIIRSLEEIAGRGANAVTYRAGKKFGHETAKYFRKIDDIEEALEELSHILRGQYTFEIWKPQDAKTYIQEENGSSFIYLVFHDCIVRQTLRRNGQDQGGPLCQTLYGYVVGAIEEITGRRARLEIVHTGPNACLKKLILK